MELLITKKSEKIICAWFEDKNLIQVHIHDENSGDYNIGDIYVGKIKNVVNNINAAFVDIGSENPCFLQTMDVGSLKRERDIVVQILRDEHKTKNQSVTTMLTLTGRYLILTVKNQISISKKITDVSKRKELKELLGENDSNIPHCGFIVRTNANYADTDVILREKEQLMSVYNNIIKKAENAKVATKIYSSCKGYIADIRDSYTNTLERIITDDEVIYNELCDYTKNECKDLNNRIEFYNDKSYSLDSFFSLSVKLKKALMRRTWLDSGAYVLCDVTEALTVFDVNSGKAIGKKKDREDTFFKINNEAAEEIMRLLRLRNLTGIIIIDFIDMHNEENKAELMKNLRSLAAKDPIKTTVVDMTALGLVEITRRKQLKPLHESVYVTDDELHFSHTCH